MSREFVGRCIVVTLVLFFAFQFAALFLGPKFNTPLIGGIFMLAVAGLALVRSWATDTADVEDAAESIHRTKNPFLFWSSVIVTFFTFLIGVGVVVQQALGFDILQFWFLRAG